MKFLLDTNAAIALLKGDGRFLERLRQFETGDFGLPALVAHELYYGAYRGQRRDHHLGRVDGLQFEVVEFDREDARMAGEVRAMLAAAGAPIGPYDGRIAGQALARDLILITHNTREFSRVAGLKLEDWE